jgi:hypothetical protein
MKNLRELTLRVGCSGGDFLDFCCDSDDERPKPCEFDWGAQFPNLVTLILDDVATKYANGFSIHRLFKLDTTPCLALKNLKVPPELDAEDVATIGHIFPNVLKLIVPLQTQDNVFPQLFTTWPQLKALVLSTLYL